jgi:hypothetical protein
VLYNTLYDIIRYYTAQSSKNPITQIHTQDTSFKPSPPTIRLQAYATNTTADVPKPLASSLGEKEITWKKYGLGGWGCPRNKFLKNKETN